MSRKHLNYCYSDQIPVSVLLHIHLKMDSLELNNHWVYDLPRGFSTFHNKGYVHKIEGLKTFPTS